MASAPAVLADFHSVFQQAVPFGPSSGGAVQGQQINLARIKFVLCGGRPPVAAIFSYTVSRSGTERPPYRFRRPHPPVPRRPRSSRRTCSNTCRSSGAELRRRTVSPGTALRLLPRNYSDPQRPSLFSSEQVTVWAISGLCWWCWASICISSEG